MPMVTVPALVWRPPHLHKEAFACIMFTLLTVLPVLPVAAQENQFEGQTVLSVALLPEESYLTKEDTADRLGGVQVGKPLSMAQIRTAIERLYAAGQFSDVVVEAEPEGSGLAIRFRVTPASFIRNVTVAGVHQPPSSSQLVNVTNLQLGLRLYPSQERQATERMLDLLRTNGFYLSSVTPSRTPQPFQQVDINFDIVPGKRARYAEPIVSGTPDKTLAQIVKVTRWRGLWGYGRYKEATDTRTQQGLDRVRRSYQKKDYLLAKVSLDLVEYREADNHVIPHLTIDRGPKVTIRTEGAKVSKSKLRELVPVYQEQTVDKDLLVEGKRELTESFRAKGYFEAEVDFDQTTSKDGEVILYSIYRGDRHKLVKVDINGNQYFDDETLRERLFTTPASLLRYRYGRFSQDYIRRDINAMKSLYLQNGFRDIAIESRIDDDHNGKKNEVAVAFEITEGAQWIVASLTIEGADDDALAGFRSSLQSSEGQPFSELNVSADLDTILSYYYNNGYPDARLDPTAVPLPGETRMDVRYVIQAGNRQYVRDVLISGLGATRDGLVDSRIRNLTPGTPLAQSAIIENQRRLYDLGIFARVDAALQNPDGETDHKYVLYRFEEASRWSINGGIGAQIARIGQSSNTNFDSPAGSAGFSPRISFGVSRNNFLGIGHTITLQTQWAPNLRQRGVLTYLAPQFKGNDALNLSFTGLFDDSRDVSTFSSRRREASVQLSQRLTRANTAQYRIAYRRVAISDIAINPALIPLFAQPVNLATVSGTFIQDRRDDPVDARRGILNTIDGAFASSVTGQPNRFSRVLGRNATYHRIGRDLILARQISFGLEFEHTRSEIPLPERFFGGGVASHRGFPDNQAGPRDGQTGFPIGGQALMFHNTELRFPLLGDNIGGVVFHDAGNVYSKPGAISFRFSQRNVEDFDYMVHAIGFGIRYRTPVGPVRADIAWSVNAPRFNGVQGTAEQLRSLDAYGPNCANLSIGCVQFVEQRISRFQFHFSLGQLF
ncbi:MAG: BamA/TamA family outer membrane protein [Bryobacteraceae bacterium]|nr:BamA/TamA family outer membrane protein [Bryobacteraceae bacterium]